VSERAGTDCSGRTDWLGSVAVWQSGRLSDRQPMGRRKENVTAGGRKGTQSEMRTMPKGKVIPLRATSVASNSHASSMYPRGCGKGVSRPCSGTSTATGIATFPNFSARVQRGKEKAAERRAPWWRSNYGQVPTLRTIQRRATTDAMTMPVSAPNMPNSRFSHINSKLNNKKTRT
jgi:hypothetical protein